MELSIVTTMYHSAPYLREFYERVSKTAGKITENYEIIFVNDGSPDNSLDVAVTLFNQDDKVRVIDLSRNFGHHRAIMRGLSEAKGELVFLIDCDLEEEPELLSQFYEELQNSDSDVVFGVQKSRKGDNTVRLTGHIFYKLFNYLSSHRIPENLTTVRLMSRRYLDGLLRHEECEIVLSGLWAITGFKQTPFQITKHDKGVTTYSLTRKMEIFVNAITSFSNRPLVYIFYIGFFIMLISSLYILYLIGRKLFFNTGVQGYTSLIISIWFLSGLMIFCLGVIGIYLGKVFMEVKKRPNTIVRTTYEKK